MVPFRLLLRAGAVAAAGSMLVVSACESGERSTFFAAPPDGDADVPANLPESGPTPEIDASTDGPAPDIDASDEPVACEVSPCAVELAAGEAHFCARMSDGTVRCWGDDTAGALGRGDPSDEAETGGDAGAPADPGSPQPVAGLTGIVQISAARRTTCAVDGAGIVRCWGSNANGQLGLAGASQLDDSARHATPTPVTTTGVFARVDVGARTACAISSAGEAICWGANEQQQLARPDAGELHGGPGPADLLGGAIVRAGATPYTSFGLTADGDLFSWGLAKGNASVSGRESSLAKDPTPALIPSLRHVTSFAAGEKHACAIANGAVWCWGGFWTLGEPPFTALCTGLTDREIRPAPAGMRSPPYPQQIAVGSMTTCARLTDGTIRCCGDDQKGQLGTGKIGTVNASFAPASAFDGYAVQVAVSASATCALLRSGAVQCWGGNNQGQLGRGGHDAGPHPVPAPVTF